MKTKKNDAENKARDSGSEAAFMEAAEKCREEAGLAFLNYKDEAADSLRELVKYFLEQAQLCSDKDEA